MIFFIILDSNYFQAFQTAIFYKKDASKMFKHNLFMFLDTHVSVNQNKNLLSKSVLKHFIGWIV